MRRRISLTYTLMSVLASTSHCQVADTTPLVFAPLWVLVVTEESDATIQYSRMSVWLDVLVLARH